ncbi:MAG: YbjN domain-containing protein [Cohaesibacteraceae bacterium]
MLVHSSLSAALLAAGVIVPTIAVSVSAAPASFEKPLETRLIGQKAPTPEPVERFETSDDYGGLGFADLEQLRLLLAEIGSVRLETDNNGQDYLSGTVDGINFLVDVYNCDPGCADLTLTATFEIDGLTNELMNEWNASRRFGKSFIRDDGDAVIQFVINTRYGITTETFRDDLIWWQDVLTDYVEFIGFR